VKKNCFLSSALLAGGLLGALLSAPSAAAESEQTSAPDPALQILPDKLSVAEEHACRKLFEQLGNEDFDTRQQALNGLVARGPAVFYLAEEFSGHRDPEVAAQAKSLKQRVLWDYDGYLPTSPALKAALRKAALKAQEEIGAEQLKLAAREAGITLVQDPNIKLPDKLFDIQRGNAGQPLGPQSSFEELMRRLLPQAGLGGIARGDAYLITTAERAGQLATQRHTFNWSGLGLGRDEAERVGKALQSFFPPVNTEVNTGSEVLIVRGEEEAIARAARLIALLAPGAPEAIWPASPGADSVVSAALLQKLAAPAKLVLSSQDPLDAIPQLKEQKHEVFVVTNAAGDVSQTPPFPKDVSGAAPLTLVLYHQPLGLVLRWIERRAKFPAEQQADMVLGYEIGPGGRLQFRLKPKTPPVLSLCVAGTDVGFLYPRAARPGPNGDAAARTALVEVLEPHLALFPACDFDRDLAVVRGRLLMQGQHATLARALEVVREWRLRNAPPPADWKKALDTRLDTPVNWDGRGLSGGKLLRTLRELGSLDLRLEDAPDGSAPHFELTSRDAQLLPPGRYPLRALLDDLARKAGAQWHVEMGAIVLIPKTGGRLKETELKTEK